MWPGIVASVCFLLATVAALLGPLGGTAVALGSPPSGHLAPLARERAIQAVTGLQSTGQLTEKAVCAHTAAGGYACAARALYDTGTGRYVQPDLARPGVHVRAAAMTVPARGLGAARAAGPFSPALPGASLPAAAPTGQGAPTPGTPAYLQQAYDLTALSASAGSGDRVAIVDAYSDTEAESDLGVYRRTFGLPACTHENGCFTQVNEHGEAPPKGGACGEECRGWLIETSLDMDAVSAVCPNCSIVLVEGRNAQGGALGAAEEEAYKLGANQVSDSWSGAEKLGLAAGHAQVATVAASGDKAQWATRGNPSAAFPAGEDAVTAVGGTDLLAPNVTGSPATRGFQESVWFEERRAEGNVVGTGSGCTSEAMPPGSEPEPPWQHQTVCPSRSANDIAADADPATGLLVYEKAAGGGLVVGGTSLAAPMTAAYYALTGEGAGDGNGEWDYTNAAHLNDVVSGSNGSCGTLICTAGAGYDGPTGNGSISGDVVLGAPGIAGPSQVNGGYVTGAQPSGVSLSAGIYANEEETSYWWEYGTSVEYGSKTAEVPVGNGAGAAAGSGGLIAVNSLISEGLLPDTTYHYRLVARNASGVTYGYDFTLTTAANPPIIGPASVVAGSTSATVTAEINPDGEEVAYGVEFGISETYGASSPTQNLAAATSLEPVTVTLDGLLAGQTYHFRLFAQGEAGRTVSKDRTFTTEPLPPTGPPPEPTPPETAPTEGPTVPRTETPATATGVGTGAPGTTGTGGQGQATGTGAPGQTTGTGGPGQTSKPAAPARSTASPLARIDNVKVLGAALVVTAGRSAGGSGTVALLLQLTQHGKVLKTVRLTLPVGASKTVRLKLTPALAARARQTKRFTVRLVLREAPARKHGRAGKILASRTVGAR